MTKRKRKFTPQRERQPLDMSKPENWGPADMKPGPGFVQPEGEFCEVRKKTRGPEGGLFIAMVEAGDVEPEELDAADQIGTAYHAIVAEVGVRGQKFERVDKSLEKDWPLALIRKAQRYQEWIRLAQKADPRMVEMVIDAVVDRRTARELQEIHKRDHRTIRRLIKQALQIFVGMPRVVNKAA